jgi:hypothetical protein
MRSAAALALAFSASAACGRINIDGRPVDVPKDGEVDADVRAQPVHRYRLSGSYSDDFGGPALRSHGGTFDASAYRFKPNEGLSLSGVMPIAVYTIDAMVAIDDLTQWRKLIDFKALAIEPGVYVNDAKFSFVERAESAGTPIIAQSLPMLRAREFTELTIVREANGRITGYIDRAPAFSIVDSFEAGTFTGPGSVVYFVMDDTQTNRVEASSGSIRDIRIWDVALTDAEVGAL